MRALRLGWIVRLILGLGLFAAVFYFLDWRTLLRHLAEVNPGTFAVALLIVLGMFLVMAIRWFRLVNTAAPLGFFPHLRFYLSAVFANLFTPANLGGDAYRVIVLRSGTARTVDLVAAVVRERLIGVVGFAVFYLGCFLWVVGIEHGRYPHAQASFSALAAVLACGLVLVWALGRLPLLGRHIPMVRRRPALAEWIDQLQLALQFGGMRRFAILLGLSLAGCVLWTLALLVVARQIGAPISFASLGLIGIFVEFARVVPLTVQGVGVREGLFAYGFSLFDLPPEQGFLVGAVAYLAVTRRLLLCGVASRFIRTKSGQQT